MPKTRMGSFWMFEEAPRIRQKRRRYKNKGKRVICDVFDKGKMPVFAAAQTIGRDSRCTGNDENGKQVPSSWWTGMSLTGRHGGYEASACGTDFRQCQRCSRITKHGMDLGKISELKRTETGCVYRFQRRLFRGKRSVPVDRH